MKPLHAIVGLAALMVIAAAPMPEIETRVFEGSGSVGTNSTIEFYLLEGTYHHRLVGIDDCRTTASVFPSRGDQGVPLSDVLQADLSVGRRAAGATETNPAGSFMVSKAGWAHIQVGTGTACRWNYSITGRFLPEGEEPVPPSQRNQWWLLVAGVAAVVGLVYLAWRRKPQDSPPEEEPIRVMDPS